MRLLSMMLVLWLALSSGCARAKMGKVDLSEQPPQFLEIGQTRFETVLERLGEPFGYRAVNGQMVISYLDFRDKYTFILIGEIRTEEAKMLVLRFEDQVLSDVQVKPEGWGLGVSVDPNAINLLVR